MEYSYYGNLKPIKISVNRSWCQMAADEVIKQILEKATDRLIDQNDKKWHHFERRFMTEINKLRTEIKEEKNKKEVMAS